jgi:hypothetical protein
MFHPDRKPKSVWNGVLVFLLLYTALIMPYTIAFIENVWFDAWFYTDLTVDTLFFFDFVINCFSAYYDKNERLETNRGKILLNYLKTWMIPDFISFFPFEMINGQPENTQSSGGYNKLIRLVRLPRLYRLLRISKVLKILKDQKKNKLFQSSVQSKASSD